MTDFTRSDEMLKSITTSSQLLEEDELSWDDGSVNPEPCLDEFNLVTKVRPSHKPSLEPIFKLQIRPW